MRALTIVSIIFGIMWVWAPLSDAANAGADAATVWLKSHTPTKEIK